MDVCFYFLKYMQTRSETPGSCGNSNIMRTVKTFSKVAAPFYNSAKHACAMVLEKTLESPLDARRSAC